MTRTFPASPSDHSSPSSTDTTDVTFDLFIVNDRRILVNHCSSTPAERLDYCIKLLTLSDIAPTVSAQTVLEIAETTAGADPDTVLNTLAKYSRSFGVNIFVTTTERPTRPAVADLYSVITVYHGTSHEIVAEHFTSVAARRQYLLQRLSMFTDSTDVFDAVWFNASMRSDEQIAAAIEAFIAPATVSLPQANFDTATGAYLSKGPTTALI